MEFVSLSVFASAQFRLSRRRGMALQSKFLARVIRASITSERDVVAYVISVTAICIVLALTVDVTNQLVFFVDWASCLRSWAITATVVVVLAFPISRAVAKTHLELYRAKMHAEELGRTDQLTGLANRRALMEAAFAAGPKALALVVADIDGFKRVNDTHGHLAGDNVIRSVGQMMKVQFGAFGCVARIGGEEFALLSIAFSLESLTAAVIAFRDRVESTPVLVGGAAIRVTVSAGVACRRDGETFDQVFSKADRALYMAKTAGRNRICFFPAAEAPRDGKDADPAELNPGAILRSA
jgi:diguanylate cyclase (GGDEF)-like protein